MPSHTVSVRYQLNADNNDNADPKESYALLLPIGPYRSR